MFISDFFSRDSSPSFGGDASGVYLEYTTKPQEQTAAMISLHVNTKLPPRTVTFQDVACNVREQKVSE